MVTPQPSSVGSKKRPLLRIANVERRVKPTYAVHVAVEADAAGVNPLEYVGRPVKMPAADFLSVLI